MGSDFKQPTHHLVDADAAAVAGLLSAASDLTLVVDGRDVVRDLSHTLNLPAGKNIRWWRDKPIEEVVQEASRPGLRSALGQARQGKTVRGFDVDHVVDSGADLPVQYSALRIAGDGRIVLMGRDMRLVSDLRSKLLASRRSTEQTARSRRQAESQYRLLFEASGDAIAMVECDGGRVREINHRAASMLGLTSAAAKGRKFASLFGRPAQGEVASVLSRVSATGQPEQLRLADGPNLSLLLFRAGGVNMVMVRMGEGPGAKDDTDDSTERGIALLARSAAEAIVLADAEGALVWANEAFLSLAGLPVAAQAIGRPIGGFLQWNAIEREIILEDARRHGRVEPFPAILRDAKGNATEVSVSVVAMKSGDAGGYGFIMRAIEQEDIRRGDSDLPRTPANILGMIGRVPMKDLVRDSADVIERMCIEAALRLTGNNRASTARVLGLSRQALYLKMNRYGITDEE